MAATCRAWKQIMLEDGKRSVKGNLDLSVVIPALNEGPNLAILLPKLRKVLDGLRIQYEILIIGQGADNYTVEVASRFGAKLGEQQERGYGGALLTGFNLARGAFVLTMDADLSHPPTFIGDLWTRREAAEVTIASRYVAGGSAEMPASRYLLSRLLNAFFSRGLSQPTRDMSSGFRLYRANVVRGRHFRARDFEILQEILVRAYTEGWRVQEVPFDYAPRNHGTSHARVFRFGLAYMRSFWSLWRLRNSISSADYDDRAYDSPIPLQRYWQRQRYRFITRLIAGEGPVVDVGCGSSRIISALPEGSVGVDILARKLRYVRNSCKDLVQASGTNLPFQDGSFSCAVCSQVIEHVPKDSQILDELCRVLAPDGRLILGTPDYDRWEWVIIEKLYGLFAPGGYADEHVSHYNRSDLVGVFEARGFALETFHYILRGELILAFRKNGREQTDTASSDRGFRACRTLENEPTPIPQ